MIFKACAVALIAAFVSVLLGELGWRGRGVLGVVAAVAILSLAADGIGELGRGIGFLSATSQLGSVAESGMKIIGIGYIFGIGSEVCLELGERATASALCLVGRIEALFVALPYFRKIAEMGIELLEL